MRYIFAGDRDIAVRVLEYLINQDLSPLALLVSADSTASHADELITCSGLSNEFVIRGKEFESDASIKLLVDLKPDYIIGIHFPYIINDSILAIPRIGFLNLHPAYLPFNRGWHTPSWTILENTSYGATLHFMSTQLDNGDIIHQKKMDVSPSDTADTLYKRVKELEFDVFKECLPQLIAGSFTRKKMNANEGTTHKRSELLDSEFQRIDLDKYYSGLEVINKLRALTTDRWNESAYFEIEDKRYRIRIEIKEDPNI